MRENYRGNPGRNPLHIKTDEVEAINYPAAAQAKSGGPVFERAENDEGFMIYRSDTDLDSCIPLCFMSDAMLEDMREAHLFT